MVYQYINLPFSAEADAQAAPAEATAADASKDEAAKPEEKKDDKVGYSMHMKIQPVLTLLYF